jgi:hypothetical protein
MFHVLPFDRAWEDGHRQLEEPGYLVWVASSNKREIYEYEINDTIR